MAVPEPDVIYGYPTAQASSLGYLISGRLFPITDSTNYSQAASQCFAVGNALDSFPFDDSEWNSYTRAKDLEVHSKVADFLKGFSNWIFGSLMQALLLTKLTKVMWKLFLPMKIP